MDLGEVALQRRRGSISRIMPPMVHTKVLVTGAFGNVGSYVTRELSRQGYIPRLFDLPTPRNQRAARSLAAKPDIVWGDMRDLESLKKAVEGQEIVIHLAAIIPPLSNEQPDLTRAVNITGTQNLLSVCEASPTPIRFLFASTFDLFGHTQKLQPPRRISDPIEVTDVYTETKLAGENMVRASSLDWLIFRLSDMPLIALRDPHPIMFEIPLDNRFESMHPADAALAIVNALKTPELWGCEKTLLVGGGKACQITYREFLSKLLTAMGIGMLPEAAWTKQEYVTDWLDTEESQRLLQYQCHSFDDIVAEVAALLGWKRFFVPLARPFVRRAVLKLSPYWTPSLPPPNPQPKTK